MAYAPFEKREPGCTKVVLYPSGPAEPPRRVVRRVVLVVEDDKDLRS